MFYRDQTIKAFYQYNINIRSDFMCFGNEKGISVMNEHITVMNHNFNQSINQSNFIYIALFTQSNAKIQHRIKQQIELMKWERNV